uniref:Uncharacterized protein n=1 Tax=Eutreptiella gymnastica TaxID=73025 RepID=A0A7S4CN90_9EUGL
MCGMFTVVRGQRSDHKKVKCTVTNQQILLNPICYCTRCPTRDSWGHLCRVAPAPRVQRMGTAIAGSSWVTVDDITDLLTAASSLLYDGELVTRLCAGHCVLPYQDAKTSSGFVRVGNAPACDGIEFKVFTDALTAGAIVYNTINSFDTSVASAILSSATF